jgi:alpha-D-xyloside xylohydrolase
MARVHLRLFPYLWTYAKALVSTGRPIQRALGLAYPTLGVHPDDEYLLGDELLVAPVVTRGATSRTLTLPPGRWLDFWTGEAHDGPGPLTVPAPLETIPLFLREGALVPLLRPSIDTLLPATQAGVDSFAADAGVLTVRVVPGAGALTLYDGTTLGQPSPRELTLSDGSVFHQGFLVELMATPSVSQVTLDDSPLSAVALSALESGSPAYSVDPAGSGTVWIRVPHGTHHVVVR